MAAPSPITPTQLQITRTFAAPREKVFRAWTDPEIMKQWFAPSDEYEVEAELELTVGGKYRVKMKHSKGVHIVGGEYREIKPPERLVFTWGWEDGSVTETLVTVEFREIEAGTELVLTHERFTDASWRDKHQQGWTGCLGRLEKRMAA